MTEVSVRLIVQIYAQLVESLIINADAFGGRRGDTFFKMQCPLPLKLIRLSNRNRKYFFFKEISEKHFN